MPIEPINKYMSQDYRNVLSTSGSPQMIDTDNPIIPVIDIQKGFPKPNAKQILKHQYLSQSNASLATQHATPTNNLKIYFVGISYNTSGATTELRIGDATTGNISVTDASTEPLIANVLNTAGQFQGSIFPPLPIECVKGLRSYVSSPAATFITGCIYWIEEIIN